MIAKLKGIIDTLGSDHLLLDVRGVCYHVFASSKTLSRLGGEGEHVVLVTEMTIRNELPQLFGFYDLLEKEWFRLLTTVQGVGARMALAILSVLTPDELVLCIYNQDKSQITRAEGVGPKLASRITTELKEKVSNMASNRVHPNFPQKDDSSKHVADVLCVLESLGYHRREATSVIQQVIEQLGKEASTGDMVRAALSLFSRRLGV